MKCLIGMQKYYNQDSGFGEKILLDTNMFIYLEDYAVTEDKVATLTKRLFDSDQYKIVIHPIIDGNGRTSRLIMNMELMRSGYVPVIIKKDNRLKYYEALDKAHTTGDYTDFVKLVTEAENEMLDRYLEVL